MAAAVSVRSRRLAKTPKPLKVKPGPKNPSREPDFWGARHSGGWAASLRLVFFIGSVKNEAIYYLLFLHTPFAAVSGQNKRAAQ